MIFDKLSFDNKEIPEELSKEEQEKLFKELSTGSKEAREKLLMHNLRLVLHEVYNKFINYNYDKYDLFSIGKIGLIKALNTYDIKRKNSFSTYAIRCIDNEIIMFIRKQNKSPLIDSLDRQIDDGISVGDSIDSNFNLELEYEQKEKN